MRKTPNINIKMVNTESHVDLSSIYTRMVISYLEVTIQQRP